MSATCWRQLSFWSKSAVILQPQIKNLYGRSQVIFDVATCVDGKAVTWVVEVDVDRQFFMFVVAKNNRRRRRHERVLFTYIHKLADRLITTKTAKTGLFSTCL